jgi:hypothetical protein
MKALSITDKEIADNYHATKTVEEIDHLILLLLQHETGGVHGGFRWKLEIVYEEEDPLLSEEREASEFEKHLDSMYNTTKP